MRLFAFFFLLSVATSNVFAQKKVLPPTPRQMPGKDPVVVIADIAAGKSKLLNWHSGGVVFKASAVYSTLTVLRKSKSATKTYEVNKKVNDIYVKLVKGDNLFILKTTNDGGDKMHLRMADKNMQYQITAHLNNDSNDTIIIKRY